MDWRHRAICRDESAELFFALGDKFTNTDDPDSPQARQVTEAKAVCARCPVIHDCRDWARATGMTGIWGGTTEDERAALPAPAERIFLPGPTTTVTTRRRNRHR
jgi:WhiB family redox-sensing transcriptional regulator